MKSNNFGQHLTMDLAGCNSELTKTDIVFNFLLELAASIGMTAITLPYVIKWLDKGTQIEGVSGFVIIAESHISVHTYPEKREVYADVFSCRNFNTNRAIDLFTEVFKPTSYEKNIIKRGVTPHI